MTRRDVGYMLSCFVWGVALGLLVIAVAGCGKDDNRPCLKSHEETTTTLIASTPGVYVPIDNTYTVCDLYGPEPSPSGSR